MARLPLAVARDSEGSMQAWQVLARAGLADGDAAAPQAGAPRPLSNAADVLQLLEDAPSQPPAEPRYRCRRRRLSAWHRLRARSRPHNRRTLQVQHYNASGGPRTADHVIRSNKTYLDFESERFMPCVCARGVAPTSPPPPVLFCRMPSWLLLACSPPSPFAPGPKPNLCSSRGPDGRRGVEAGRDGGRERDRASGREEEIGELE